MFNGPLCYQSWQPSVWLPALRHQRTHFSSMRRKWLAKTPAMRMMTMSSNVRPRRKTSCVTDRTSPTVVVVVLLWPGICPSWYVWSSWALSQLGAVVLTCAWLWFESGSFEGEPLVLTKYCHPRMFQLVRQSLPEFSIPTISFSSLNWTPALTRAWSETLQTAGFNFKYISRQSKK